MARATILCSSALLLAFIILSYGTISCKGRQLKAAENNCAAATEDGINTISRMVKDHNLQVSDKLCGEVGAKEATEFEPASSSAKSSGAAADDSVTEDIAEQDGPGHSPGVGHSSGPAVVMDP